MCEFDLHSFRCAVTGDICRQLDGMRYLDCASRVLGFTVYDYSIFISCVTALPYPRPSPLEYDWELDTYLEPPF